MADFGPDDIGRVQTAAQPHFDHRDIHSRLIKIVKGHPYGELKKGKAQGFYFFLVRIDEGYDEGLENRCSVYPDPLAKIQQVGRGV